MSKRKNPQLDVDTVPRPTPEADDALGVPPARPKRKSGAAASTDALPTSRPTPPINAPAPSGKGFLVFKLGLPQQWDAERGMLQGYLSVPPTVFADKEQAETRIRQTIERWPEAERASFPDAATRIFTVEPIGKHWAHAR